MKICIVIQSDAFRDSAGMRIRYNRFREFLGEDASIDAIKSSDLIAAKTLDHDVYIFCKTFDTGALLLARRVRGAGKVVGQDLFDDYFTQYADPRLERYRRWLRDMVPVTDFVICSTPRMAEAVRPYMPDTRVTVIEDPVAGLDCAAVVSAAEAKIARAKASRQLDVVWFGIGDNPFFQVGLTDLAACDGQFALMERLGWTVNLRVVTNRRPFEGAGAEILRPLSVGFELIEWSEQAEREALAVATVAVLPVNGQLFSRAKSLNRAITALQAGCQVLSIGYPLYERLGELIYRSTEELLADLEAGTPRLRDDTTEMLSAAMKALADPADAAAALEREARRAIEGRGRSRRQGPVCLVHGRNSTIGLHKLVSAIGGLSVRTIFTTPGWNFPVRFDRVGTEIIMRITPQVAQKFSIPAGDPSKRSAFGSMEFVDVDHLALGVRKLRIHLSRQPNPILDLAIYEDVMRYAEECCAAAFPGADILISETSPFSRLPRRREPSAALSKRSHSRAAAGRSDATSVKPPPPMGTWHRVRKLASLARNSRSATLERAAAMLEASSLFDPDWYLERYPDVAQSGADPAHHYLEFGWLEGRNPGPAFSTNGYLKAHKDVAAQRVNPLLHYLEYGQLEGRKAPTAVKGSQVQ